MRNNTVSKAFFYSGIGLLSLSALLGAGEMTGLASLSAFVPAGESTLHTIARIAVIGCVLAAIGSRD